MFFQKALILNKVGAFFIQKNVQKRFLFHNFVGSNTTCMIMKKGYFLVLLVFMKVGLFAQSWITFDTNNSAIPTDAIISIYAENDHKIWLCTYDKGLVKYNGNSYTEYSKNTVEELDFDFVRCMTKDSTGHYWIATDFYGLYKFDGSNWTKYTPQDMGFDIGEFQTLTITALAVQQKGPGVQGGALWVGTYLNGLAKFDGSTWTHYDYSTGDLPENGIHTIAVENAPNDTASMIWVGTGQGLMVYNGQQWNRFKIDGDSTLWINAVAFDNGGISFGNGTMYVGSELGVYGIYDGETWDIFNLANAWSPNNCIKDIAIDANHRQWIATTEEGLYFYDGTQLPAFNTENSPIPANNIFSVDATHDQDSVHIWISANYTGLTRYSYALANSINEMESSGVTITVSPNPVKDVTEISFDLPTTARVNLALYDLQGRKRHTLLNNERVNQHDAVQLNAKALSLKPGMYLLVLEWQGQQITKKLMVE